MSDPAPAPAATSTEEKPSNPFAALGSTGAAAFGGFNFGAASTSSAPAKPAAEEDGADGGDDDAEAAEEECQAEFKPIVQLEEVETNTGEEDEDVLLELKCKLYRFDNDAGEWKERGVGQAKLLQHKENKKCRLLMRQDKTLKIRANHLVMPGVKLQEHAGNDKAWVWSTVDFSEEQQKVELFCMRFGSTEKAQEFKKKFEEVQEINSKLIGAPATTTGKEGEEAAEELAKEVEDKAAV